MQILQQARQAAVEQAGEAARDTAELRASARQLTWGQGLLDSLLSDQLKQNSERAAALEGLLARPSSFEADHINGTHLESPESSSGEHDDAETSNKALDSLPSLKRPILADIKAHLLQMQLDAQ